MMLPREEYPRPQFVRDSWMCLNGEWDFSFREPVFDQKIIVPYVYQAKLSGITMNVDEDIVWYKKTFTYDSNEEERVILHFGAVDYFCKVFVNDKYVKEHTGGHVPFSVEITDVLQEGINSIVVEVHDDVKDLEKPRGKQFWNQESDSIFYTRTTGIWQSVWLEMVPKSFLKKVDITPDIDYMKVDFKYEIEGPLPTHIRVDVRFKEHEVTTVTAKVMRNEGVVTVHLDSQLFTSWRYPEDLLWTPERPDLFEVTYSLCENDKTIDVVGSYFGMRKISIENGKFLLNNRTYYQKLLLDQGYWPDGLLTAPCDEDYVKDIELSKSMGFNGVRKHQKIEDPRFLYHADKMGFLVWGEIAAGFIYSSKYVERITNEWMAAVARDYNHPCIVAWTPLNESWGMPNVKENIMQQSHSAAMVYLTKSLDGTRPVISNDGWVQTCTDLLTIHDYEWNREVLEDRYSSLEKIFEFFPAGLPIMANGWEYKGQPILLTEFGGISFKKGENEGWGYSNAKSEEDFAKRYNDVIAPILKSPLIQGFCYTELTDVEQEINGLLTYDRKPKIPVEIIKSINEGVWNAE